MLGDCDTADGHIFGVKIRGITVSREKSALVQTVIQSQLIETYPDKPRHDPLKGSTRSWNGYFRLFPARGGKERRTFICLVEMKCTPFPSVPTYNISSPSPDSEDITLHPTSMKGLNLCVCVSKLIMPWPHRTQIKYVADAGDIVVRAKDACLLLYYDKGRFSCRQVSGNKARRWWLSRECHPH